MIKKNAHCARWVGVAFFALLAATGWTMKTPAEFGAVGDGKADDTEALREALEGGGAVGLDGGMYRITGRLNVSGGTTLTGPGKLVVDFDTGKPDAENTALIVSGEGIVLDGLTIAKNFIDGSYGSGIVVLSGSRNIAIRDVEISGYSARYGIHIVETEEFSITGCYIHDFMVDTAADMIADSPAGLRVTRSSYGVVANNRIMRIEVGPVAIKSISPLRPQYGPQNYQSDHMTIAQCRKISITGNVMESSGEGIDLLLSRECTVSGNVIGNIWLQGIKMLGVSFCSVTGNQIYDCLQGIGLNGHGGFDTACIGNTVVGNTIMNTGATGNFPGHAPRGRENEGYAIEMTGATDHNTVSNNTMLDVQQKKTMDAGVFLPKARNNVARDNVVVEDYTLDHGYDW